MRIELTTDEIRMILSALNSVGVHGLETMRQIIALATKLEHALNNTEEEMSHNTTDSQHDK